MSFTQSASWYIGMTFSDSTGKVVPNVNSSLNKSKYIAVCPNRWDNKLLDSILETLNDG